MGTFTAEEVREAYGRISPYLDRTPLAEALYLKAEGRKFSISWSACSRSGASRSGGL